MPLRDELKLPNPIIDPGHEALLNVVVTAALLVKEGDRIARPYGITAQQLNVLMLLRYQATGEGLHQNAIGRMLVVNRSNVTSLVDRMERGGLVSRMEDSQDRRAKRVRLTAKGGRMLASAEKPYIGSIRRILGALPAPERERMVRSLEALRKVMRKGE